MRKFLITAIAMIAVGAGYFIVTKQMDQVPLTGQREAESPDIEMPKKGGDSPKIGEVKIIDSGETQYIEVDKVTKEPVAALGFKKLLNPGQGRTRWEVEEPYIIFYRPDYHCRIDSKRGILQMDPGSSSNIPKDAQLDEDVVIHVKPITGDRLGETFIYMDDLLFSSERSEFTTNGPVRIDSPQMQMDGFGLDLIFNTAVGKIEYLHLRDLEYLRLKEFAALDDGSKSKSGSADSPSTPAAASPKDKPAGKETEESNFYLCTIEDNVEIQYGKELVVSGADRVNIQNIDFSGMDDDAKADSTSPTSTTEKKIAVADAKTDTTPVAETGRDVVVKCDGGIIIKPMPTQSATAEKISLSDVALEMSGAPLRIDRIVPTATDSSETLAHCGLLTYTPADDVLRLFTSPLQPEILLNAEQSHSRIQTSGNVFWDRRADRANIAGPGKVTIGNARRPSAEPSEINFQGVMDLLFARMPQETTGPAIQTINLTGGMDAVLRQNGTLKTKSETAVLEFGRENTISQARLDGDVKFESLDAEKPSQATSDSAVFHFANNQIALADLKGDVSFASTDGNFASSDAVIEFHPDADGAMHPKMLRTTGEAIMQTVSPTEQPPAKFEARKIDYDLETGSGLAHGPIRVTYYQQADPTSESLEPWIPLTITADGDAQFTGNDNRGIKQVILQENVIATRLLKTVLFTQRDQLHGDKLVVNFDKDAAGDTVVDDMSITEGNVYVQSQKTRGEETLFNVKLNCEKIDYSQVDEIVTATGPGKIELDNSKAVVSESASKGFNLKRPCVGRIRDFETLQWNLGTQKLIADGQKDTMEIHYWALKDRKIESEIKVASVRLEAEFATDSNGKTELSRVFTDQGIVFERTPGDVFAGQTLEYNALSDDGWLTITGSEANPCFINGVRTPKIRYNINTGQLDTSISATPGLLSR